MIQIASLLVGTDYWWPSSLHIPALALDVEANVLVSLGVGGVELADHLLGFHARILGQNSGNHLQGLGKPETGTKFIVGDCQCDTSNNTFYHYRTEIRYF